MQFIHEMPIHQVIRSEISALHDVRGRMVTTKQRRLFAKFERGVPAWAVDYAVKNFEMANKPEDVEPGRWAATYDSIEAQKKMDWTDAERKEIEERLVALGYQELVVPKLPKPWPKIDEISVQGRRTQELVADKLVEMAAEIGVEMSDVVAYVRQEAAGDKEKRPSGWNEQLIAALEARVAPVEAPAEELVEA